MSLRSPTPPRIVAHKPPRPSGPPPLVAARAAVAEAHELLAMAKHGDAGRPTMDTGAAVASQSQPAQPPQPRAGWLVKEGGVAVLGKPSWRRRYFVLDGGVLTYYADRGAHERGEPPTKGNVIHVRSYHLDCGVDCADIVLEAFAAEGGGKPERAWRFRCESRSELKAWVDALVAHGAHRRSLNG